MPLVSTIIPAYNAAAFVREAIESALAQEGVDQEVIVVDDGSTDNTPQILAEYGDQIRVITQENRGLPKTRNRGAKAAQGEWLAFLDADDIWLSNKLRRQLTSVEPETELLFTQRLQFDSDTGAERIGPEPHHEFCGKTFERLLDDNPITVSSVVMRANAFHRVGGFGTDPELYGCEDWDLWLRFAQEGGRFAYIPEPLTRYRVHAGSMSRNIDRMHNALFEVLNRAIHSDRGQALSPKLRRNAYAMAWSNVGWRTAPINRWKALLAYFRAISYMPTELAPCKAALKCLLGRV